MEEREQYEKVKYLPAGDRALVAEFGRVIDETVNARVHQLSRALEEHPIRGVTETIPTFRSLMICYDPSVISYRALTHKLDRLELAAGGPGAGKRRILEVPCLYDGEDLADMEQLTGLSREEIISLHSGTVYKIFMLGFLPGFVYLGGLDPRLCAPRLTVPRTKIPAGSVGIGGNQTGVYPIASPGGWRLLGRTPLRFYDPLRPKPILCSAGEYIHFVPISEEKFHALDVQIKNGTCEPVWREEGVRI